MLLKNIMLISMVWKSDSRVFTLPMDDSATDNYYFFFYYLEKQQNKNWHIVSILTLSLHIDTMSLI